MIAKGRIASCILHPQYFIDEWFPFRYALDLYVGCSYGCLYCPAFLIPGKTVFFKRNALELLKQELQKARTPNLVGIGGGLNDPFQDLEKTHRLAINAIEAIWERGLTPFIMTKSSLVKEVIPRLPSQPHLRPIVTVSLSSVDDAGARLLEPDTPLPSERFRLLKDLATAGVEVGVACMPMIPAFNDSFEEMRVLLESAKHQGALFVLFQLADIETMQRLGERGLWGKKGYFPEQVQKWLNHPADFSSYSESVYSRFIDMARRFQLPIRLPPSLLAGRLNEKDLVVILLRHLYYLHLYMNKNREGYKIASYHIHRMNEDEFGDLVKRDKLLKITGVGPRIELLIHAFLKKDYRYYDKIEKKFYSKE